MSESGIFSKDTPNWQKIMIIMIASIVLGFIGYFFLSFLFGPDSMFAPLTLVVVIGAGIYLSWQIVTGKYKSNN